MPPKTMSDSKKDVAAPKDPLAAWRLFMQEARPRLAKEGLKGKRLMKKASSEWKRLEPQIKAKFLEAGDKPKAKPKTTADARTHK